MNLTRKKEAESQFKKELQKQSKQNFPPNSNDDEEGLKDKIKSRERISKQLMRFILLNDIDKYAGLDARNVAYELFDKIYSIREGQKNTEGNLTISASSHQLKFNYVLKSLLAVSRIITSKEDALNFLQEVVEKLKSNELDILINTVGE